MALQIRRGTNAERLGITLVEGEIAYVTDFELVTIEVTSINVSTDTLTTTLNHGLSVNDQIKFIGNSANGLVAGTVYFVKTVPDANNFTLSATQGGATFNITGTTGSVSLTFAVGPTDALGTPYGYTISPVYVGDGVTAGGNPAGASVLADLYDVEIGVYGNVGQYGEALDNGQFLVFNEDTLKWENTNTVSVTDVAQTPEFVRQTTDSAETTTTLRTALRIGKTITDGSNEDNGGPAILFQTTGSNGTKGVVQTGAQVNSSGNHDFVVRESNDGFSTANTLIISNPVRTSINEGVLYVDKTNNRVGVNNTSPTYSLDVAGNGRFTQGGTFSNTTVGVSASGTITTLSGDLTLDSASGQTTINTNAVVAGDLTVTGNDIKKSGGTTVITFSGTNLTTLAGDLTVTGNTIRGSAGADAIEISGSDISTGDITLNGGDIRSSGGAVAITVSSGNVSMPGNLTVSGDLTVNGTTTNLDTVNLVIEDNTILLNKNESGSGVTAGSAGIEIERGTGSNVSWLWNETNKWWYPEGDFANQTVWAGNYLIAGTGLATNGNLIIFNNEDSTDANCDIQVKRGTAETYDAFIRWNSTVDRWQFNNGDNLFRNMVISIDDLSDVTMSGPSKGSLLYHNGSEWVNATRLEFNTNANRLQLVNNVTGGNSALELLKRGGSTIADGEAVGQLFGAITTGDTKTQMHRLWSVYDSSGNHEFKIQNDSTNSFGSGSTTVLDSLSISKVASYLQSDYQTFNSGSGNTTYLTLNGAGSQVLTDFTIGNATSDNLTVNSQVNGNITFKATDTWTGITGVNGTNDAWKIGGYASGSNAGELIIATGDDQSEPIVFRQYSGNFDTGGYRQTVIMDASGNANFCGEIDTIGAVTVGGTLTVEGSEIVLYNDSGFRVERGATDATFKWNEANDFWQTNYSIFANDGLISGNYLATNGNDIYFNNENGTAGDARITVKRPSGGNPQIVWSQSNGRWQTTVDSSTYLNIPNQNLDTNSDVNFAGVTIDNRATFNTGAVTTTSTSAFTLDETNRNAIKCMVYISSGTDSHAVEILIMRTASSAMMTTYGEMYTTAPLATFTADQSGGNIRIRCTPASATSTTFSVVRYSLT